MKAACALSVRCIDSVCLVVDEREHQLKNRKLLALLTLFIVERRGSLSRDRIAAMLWSAASEEKARASLRNLLYQQKTALPPELPGLFRAERDQIVLAVPRPETDYDRLLQEIGSDPQNFAASVSLSDFGRRYFGDLDNIDPQFDDWLAAARESAAEDLRRRLSDHLDEAEPDETHRWIALKLLQLCPEDEVAARYLMRLDMARGNSAAALATYEALWRHLDDEYDVEPSPATQALVVEVKMQSAESPPDREPRTCQPRTTIFVRDFGFEGLSPGVEYFVRGVQAELLNALFSVREWVIVEPDESEVLGPQLGHYELKGAVAPGLGKLRLILTLKDLSDRRIVWNHSIEIGGNLWVEASARAVMRLASLLVDSIEFGRLAQLEAAATPAASEYDRLVHARVLMYDWDREKDRAAEAMLRSLLDTPSVANGARIGLTELLNSRHLVYPGTITTAEERAEALEMARRSCAEDPDNPAASLCRAWAALLCAHAGEAQEAAGRAANASLSSPRRIASAAEVFALSGDSEEAGRLAQISHDLDLGVSRLNHGYRVSVHFANEAYDACLAAADRARGAIVLGYGYAAAAARCRGDDAQASRWWTAFRQRTLDGWSGEAIPGDAELADWLIENSPFLDCPARERFETALRGLDIDALSEPA